MEKILIITILCTSAVFSQGIGTTFQRTFGVWEVFPLTTTNASSLGWASYGDCDPNLGYPWSNEDDGPTKSNPITLFFTGEGQICGMGMTHYGDPAPGLGDYWVGQSDGTYFMSVTFRPNNGGNGLCDPETQYAELIGTQVSVNQGFLDLQLPLIESQAQEEEWTAGSCIGKMGTHWSYDLADAPYMEWNASTLLPVVTMYNNGNLSAFFFTTSNVQLSEPFGPWEGPILDAFMCLNWCDSSCSFNVLAFSTLHFFVTDPDLNLCPERCSS